MQWFLNVRKPSFNLSDNANEVIYVQTPTGWASNHSDPAFSQLERFQNLPRDPHLFLRFGSKRYSNRVSDALVQENAKPNGRFDRSGESCTSLRDSKVKRIVDLFRQQAISGDSAMNVRGL